MTGRRRAIGIAVLTIAATFVLRDGMAGSRAAYTAQITNSTDSLKMGYTRCVDAAHAYGARRVYPLADSALVATAADLGTDGATGVYQGTALHTNVSASYPCLNDPTTVSTTLNGLTQWVSAAQTLSVTVASNITESIWFKTTVKQGVLLSIGNGTIATVSTVKGLELFLNSAGNVVFATNDGSNHELVNPLSYADGTWHEATAVYASGGTTTLYLDGVPVAASTPGGAGTGSLTNCTLRIGWDSTSGFTNGSAVPTTYFFSGSVSFAELYGSALTAQQVLDLYRST